MNKSSSRRSKSLSVVRVVSKADAFVKLAQEQAALAQIAPAVCGQDQRPDAVSNRWRSRNFRTRNIASATRCMKCSANCRNCWRRCRRTRSSIPCATTCTNFLQAVADAKIEEDLGNAVQDVGRTGYDDRSGPGATRGGSHGQAYWPMQRISETGPAMPDRAFSTEAHEARFGQYAAANHGVIERGQRPGRTRRLRFVQRRRRALRSERRNWPANRPAAAAIPAAAAGNRLDYASGRRAGRRLAAKRTRRPACACSRTQNFRCDTANWSANISA